MTRMGYTVRNTLGEKNPTQKNVKSFIWSLKTKLCMLAESGNRRHWPFELFLNYWWFFSAPMDWNEIEGIAMGMTETLSNVILLKHLVEPQYVSFN